MLRAAPLLVVVALVAGCGTTETKSVVPTARLGVRAPEYDGKTYTTLASFAPGFWALTEYMDPEFAKQMGMSSLTPGLEDQPVDDVFEFKEDGTFVFRRKNRTYKITGTWKDQGQTLFLLYEAYDGKPLAQAREELMKEAEGGTPGAIKTEIETDFLFNDLMKLTTLRVASDRRMLLFANDEDPMGGHNASGTGLERLGDEENGGG
jgi:hypothetical protein